MRCSALTCILVHIAILCLLTSPVPVSAELSDSDCLSCHQEAAKVKRPVDPEILGKSKHADLSCTDCHEGISEREHAVPLPKVECAGCHEDEQKEFKGSVHALAKVDNNAIRPSCQGCHGTHDILGKKNKDSRVHPNNLPKTCGHCHSQSEVISRFSRRGIDPVQRYLLSPHSKQRPGDSKGVAATCADCHGSHRIFAPLHPDSSTNKLHVAQTCGKCHGQESKEYMDSVHWESLSHLGHVEAPTCFDCHGEHNARIPGAEAEQFPAMASSMLCANCHANKVLMERFGLDANRFSSYLKTYHGLAVLRGSPRAASCVSCHEVHAIKGKANPRSSVNPENLESTCGQCHANTSPSFISVSVHPLNMHERNPVAYFFRIMYIWMIVLVLGGMLVHNIIILWYYLQERWLEKKSHKLVRRFSGFQVGQHFVLFVSFTTLAVTGFALKFPDAWWVQILSQVGLTEAVRGSAHRAAGVVLVASSLAQCVYFVGWRAGRREVLALVPKWSDVVAFIQTMAFYLRLRPTLPQAGRYDYTEKAEYLALIWGTFVMAATGFILWFPEFFLSFLPFWSFEVAEVVHFFEALLAVSAIIIWHFFFTIFHPDRYPMNMAWIDGKITAHEQEHHHGLEEPEAAEEK